MGMLRQLAWPVSSMAAFVLVLGMVLNVPLVCTGGKTSTFMRKLEKTEDMPLDSDVFRVPPGYNAPQQVCVCVYTFLPTCFSS